MHRAGADAGLARERGRQQRLLRIGLVLALVAAWLWLRVLTHQSVLPPAPDIDPMYLMVVGFLLIALLAVLIPMLVAGRSPHVVYRPEQIDVSMADVKGLDLVKEDAQRSLEVFLSAATFRREMGGTPRRGLLFEGPPGTGKTHLAKAMAAEAGVPFLFVSATSFQSMYYGATARKIRSYFKALRKAARSEGAAIGFIEEIDAIGLARGGMAQATPATALSAQAGSDCGGLVGLPALAAPAATTQLSPSMSTESTGGVLNELLVQLQSFDQPTSWQRVQSWGIDLVNSVLPAERQLPLPRPAPVDVLVIAATNRADSLDPALLRPGRFDRRLVFDLPDKTGRRQIVDHFLATKAHEDELSGDERRDALAGVTQGYSPVMIERLLDEALVNALRRGAAGMSWADLEHARMVTEVGLGRPVTYTAHEKRLIATHEAGHAVTAWLVAPQRRLEILTIIKRNGALGLLAHGDRDDVYTRSRTELEGLMQISFGGQVAEEVFFHDVSTGPGGDLTYATTIAAQMVGQAGMAGTLVSYSAINGTTGNLVAQVLSDGDGRRMVEELLRLQKERTRGVVAANRDLVAALRDALLERHELIGAEITDVLAAAKAARTTPAPVGLAAERVDYGVLGAKRSARTERQGAYLSARHPFQQDQSLPPRLL